MSLFTKLFNFVIFVSNKYSIDESHGLSHSMNVLNFAYNIYSVEKLKFPQLNDHERIIYISAIIHDMCDKKYMSETDGIKEIENFLEYKIDYNEIMIIRKIISTMSYSTVKKNGFPDLGEYQKAYHVVRESDLLSAYDFDRCMVYNLQKINPDFEDTFDTAVNLFNIRVLKHNNDNLFTTQYAKEKSVVLHNDALLRIDSWKQLLKIKSFK